MIAKLNPSIVAALAVAVLAGCATSNTSSSQPSALAQVDANETGVPASVDYPNRPPDATATNAEIDSGETGVPASVDYRQRAVDPHSPTNDEIDAAEEGNPDSYNNRDLSVPDAGAPAIPEKR